MVQEVFFCFEEKKKSDILTTELYKNRGLKIFWGILCPSTHKDAKNMVTNCQRMAKQAKFSHRSMRTSFWSKIGAFKVF